MSVKTRIQNLAYRIQKAENAHGGETAVGGTPTAATGTVAIPETGRKVGLGSGFVRAEAGGPGLIISNPPGSAHLNVPKTAFAHLGPPSPTSIFK
jgi:hypothetical protein